MCWSQELSGGSPSANILNGGIDEFFRRADGSGSVYPLTDGLGSVLALADSSGTLQTQYTYDPFGVTTATGTTSGNPSQYTARDNDGTGLYYYRGRYYNSIFGRFVSEDPIEFKGGINLYRYAKDSPTKFTDPFGWDVTITLWPGAGGNGHIGIGVNTTDTVGFYPARRNLCLIVGCDVPGNVRDDELQHPGSTPEVIVIPTTPDQDAAMQRAIDDRIWAELCDFR